MKRILYGLMIISCFCLINVQADTCTGVQNEASCDASNTYCLNNLQQSYNKWNSSESHSGTACLKVIAQYVCSGGTYQSKSYLSGYDPNTNYSCASGYVATRKLYNAAVYSEDVTGSCTSTLYVPELWEINCGSTGGNVSNNDVNNNGNTNDNTNNNNTNNNSSNSNNNTNEDGQITGTTDPSNTGVETYFIVLLIMVLVSYIVLFISKKKNLFKSI